MRIVVLEDEQALAEIIGQYLQQAGFDVQLLARGDELLPLLARQQVDLLVLDLMLPGADGLTLCRQLRQQAQYQGLGIIITTARVEEVDRLLGLELGADDYLCKPYSPRELVARVKAVLRRRQPEPEIIDSGLQLDPERNRVQWQTRWLELTLVEFRLLQALQQARGRILSRDQLMNSIYSDQRIVSDRTIDSHIKKLRQRLRQLDDQHEWIQSVYGAGYQYCAR